MAQNRKVLLALGGGGARGLAHLGVLEVLERERIPLQGIVGISAGALVGASYALAPDAGTLKSRSLSYFRSSAFRTDLFKKVLFHSDSPERNFLSALLRNLRKGYIFSSLLRKPGIFSSEMLLGVIADLVPDATFADLRVPFAALTLDLRSGDDVLIRDGPVRDAVLASCSLPAFFPPIVRDGRLLVDPGTLGPVPVDAARTMAPDSVVVAVDITQRIEAIGRISLGIEALLRAEMIAGVRMKEAQIARADVVIRPELRPRAWSDFDNLDGIVDSGHAAAEAALKEIRQALGRGD